MDDDVIRILVATDNHLGFLEKDAIRGNDSFAAFEEIFLTAKTKSADFVLLAGDLFHENKPSRRTLHASLDILRKHCLGESPVYIEMLNEQSEIFKTRQGRVNYEDPYHAISLPVFAIHGNHDDPSREGGHREALAALDLLAVSNLINYFGKTAQVDDIEITPILIRKQSTTIAIYGLGAIRDERLNRMWNQKKVKFVRPAVEQGRDEYFNIFILHQNRDYGRGQKNCVHESMIPEWMDLVIWGNEHECQPRLNESLVGTFRIFQPGSSVACSLVEGESNAFPKHMGLLEIKSRHFRLLSQRFTQIRPFKYSDMVLRDCHGLDPHDPQIEDQLKQILTARVNEMVEEARLDSEFVSTGWPEQLDYRIESPHLVLVRLRVEHTGFPSLNQQRFGTQFMNVVANPPSILQFTKKRKEGSTGRIETTSRSAVEMLQDEGEGEEALSKISIEDLVKESLETGNKRLGLLAETDLARALEDFVIRKHISAISDTVEESLERTQGALCKDNTILAADRSSIADAAARVKDITEKNTRRETRLLEARTTTSRKSNKNNEDNDSEVDEVDLRHALRNDSDDDRDQRQVNDNSDDDEDEDVPKKKTPAGRGRKAGGTTAKGNSRGAPATSKTTSKTTSRSKAQQSPAKGSMSQKSLLDYSARISDSSSSIKISSRQQVPVTSTTAAGRKAVTSSTSSLARTSRINEDELDDFDDDDESDGFGSSKVKTISNVRGKATTSTNAKSVAKISPSSAVLSLSSTKRGTASRSVANKKTSYKELSDNDDEELDDDDNNNNGGVSEEESYRPKKYEVEEENDDEDVIELADSEEEEEVVKPKRGQPTKKNEKTSSKSSKPNTNKKVGQTSKPATKPQTNKSQRAYAVELSDDNSNLSEDDYRKGVTGASSTSGGGVQAKKLLQTVSDIPSTNMSTTTTTMGGGKKRQLPLSFSQQQNTGASQRKRNKPTTNSGLNIDAWD